MKKYLITMGVVLIACSLIGCSKKGEAKVIPAEVQPKGTVAISFDYNQRKGYSSNQYAIWIEDEEGKLVKTICATQFAAQGGYTKRPEAIPTWVEKSKLSTYTQEEVDAITTATPETGHIMYVWDGYNDQGELVMPGKYQFFLEANVYEKSRVLYSGFIDTSGKTCEVIAIPQFTADEAKESDLILDVCGRYLEK